MRKIVRLDMHSTVRLFVASYAVIGLYSASKAAILGDESILAPFGFAYPLCTLYFYLTIHLPNPATFFTGGIILITTVFFALTGAISGATVVFVYNFLARFWPLLSAEFAPDPHSAQSAPAIALNPASQLVNDAVPLIESDQSIQAVISPRDATLPNLP
jgi:hypothetical protein